MADVGTSVAKFLKHPEQLARVQAGAAWPIHLAVLCTSRCQLACPFCAVKNRERCKDLDIELFKRVVGKLVSHGMRAIQFSGGDPFAWPHIDEAITFCNSIGIRMGIQSNGVEAREHVAALGLQFVKWLRCGIYSEEQLARLQLDKLPKSLNLSITTVWHEGMKRDFLRAFRDYGRKIGAVHARVVQDLFSRNSEHAQEAPEIVRELGAPLVFVRRSDDKTDFCAIAWWKTALDWDGYLYACGCIAGQGQCDLPPQLRICHADDAEEFYAKKPRDLGHRCVPCSYRDQNAMLKAAMAQVDDPEFL